MRPASPFAAPSTSATCNPGVRETVMRVLVVGSEGFIGEALVSRLLTGAPVGGNQGASLVTLLDRRIAARPANPLLRRVDGDICDRAVLARAIEGGVDCVFPLAS